ncbi:hypothetical protein HUW46_06999 [Amycolatopsis sp. CA-230715]|nr:hypothetical protein HUW46_06999 [Amycolatopsis sp. CA-230715]
MRIDPATLGAVLSRYRVSRVRLLPIGFGALVVAGIVCALTIPMMRSGYSYRYTMAINIGIWCTVFAALAAILMFVYLALRGLKETFEARSAGLVHTAKGRIRAWPWHEVASMKPVHIQRSTWLTRLLVRDYTCTIRFSDGAVLKFSGELDGHEDLEQAIRANCPQCTIVPEK